MARHAHATLLRRSIPAVSFAIPAVGYRVLGLVTAAGVSTLLWALIIKAGSAAFGFHPANSAIALAVAPIALFLALVLAPIMLRKNARSDSRPGLQETTSSNRVAIEPVQMQLQPVTRRRRASSV